MMRTLDSVTRAPRTSPPRKNKHRPPSSGEADSTFDPSKRAVSPSMRERLARFDSTARAHPVSAQSEWLRNPRAIG